MKINLSKYKKLIVKAPDNLKIIGLVTIPAILYLIRGWQYIRTPQLYAEDGTVWLTNAYNTGWHTLFTPYNGFAHTTERLFALIITQFPLRFAPLIFNLAGYGLFILMCYYLFSTRTKIFSNNYQKIFMAFSLGLIANFGEFVFNFSNSIFLLGIIGLCIYFAKPPKNIVINILEKILFILACLTLPFAWFYLLIILIDWIWRKQRRIFFSIIGSIIQLCAHVFSKYSRSSIPTKTLITSRYTVIELYNQIITPALRFARIDVTATTPLHKFLMILIFCFVLACLLLATLIKQGAIQLKFLAVFCILFTIASLKSPLVGGNLSSVNILKFMDTAEFGNRYFFYGILFLLTILAVAASAYINKKAQYYFLVAFMVFSLLTSVITGDFKINKGFNNYANTYTYDIVKLNTAKPGNIVQIPENPGTAWFINLDAKK